MKVIFVGFRNLNPKMSRDVNHARIFLDIFYTPENGHDNWTTTMKMYLLKKMVIFQPSILLQPIMVNISNRPKSSQKTNKRKPRVDSRELTYSTKKGKENHRLKHTLGVFFEFPGSPCHTSRIHLLHAKTELRMTLFQVMIGWKFQKPVCLVVCFGVGVPLNVVLTKGI